MDNKKKKQIFTFIIAIATIILIGVGSTFAYFSAVVTSEENAVSMTAAIFSVDLVDDTSLIKTSLIPSAEKYVDMASIQRVDENGNFLKPYEENGEVITEGTTCVDDNLNEICSIYTFTIENPMTTTDLPLYVELNPTVNSFTNLYFKVLDENQNIVMEKHRLVDDRPYQVDNNGIKIYEEGARISPVVLTGIDVTLPRATVDTTTGEVVPSKVTYSIVMWILETGWNQTKEDGDQVFAGTLSVKSSGADGQGITGVLTTGGVE